MKNFKLQKGFVALVTLLVISAVSLAVSISISLLGVGSVRGSLDMKKGNEALYVAKACFEDTILRLKNDSSYAGGLNKTLGNGECDVLVVENGSERTIDIEARVQDTILYTRRVSATVEVVGNSINVKSYSEI